MTGVCHTDEYTRSGQDPEVCLDLITDVCSKTFNPLRIRVCSQSSLATKGEE